MIKKINQFRKFVEDYFSQPCLEEGCVYYEILKDEIVKSGADFVKQCYKYYFFREFNIQVTSENDCSFKMIVEYGYKQTPHSIFKKKLKKPKNKKKNPILSSWDDQLETMGGQPEINLQFQENSIKPIPILKKYEIVLPDIGASNLDESYFMKKYSDKLLKEGWLKDANS